MARKREALPDGRYSLESLQAKEIMDKYPDKVVAVKDQRNQIILILDTCKIVFRK